MTTTLTRKDSKSTRLHTARAQALVPEGRKAVAFEMQGSAADKAVALAEDIRRGNVTARATAAEILRRGKLARVLAKASKADREVIARFVKAEGLID